MAVHRKLTKVVKKWQQIGVLMGKKKGWFVVYSVDRRRYALPLELLEKQMFVEMLKIAEEEFGLSNHQSIVFPFDSSVMDRIVDILLSNKRGAHQEEVATMMMLMAAEDAGCSVDEQIRACSATSWGVLLEV